MTLLSNYAYNSVSRPFSSLSSPFACHGVKKWGSQHVAHQGNLDWREPQKSSYKPAHEFLRDTLRIVKYQVLKCPSLKALQNDSLKGGLRMENPLFALDQAHRTLIAFQCADTTPQAKRGFNCGIFFLFGLRILYGNHLNCIDWTGLCTFPTAKASVRIVLSNETGSYYNIRVTKFADALEKIATVFTTVAYKSDISFHIVRT